jgi:hypothetical protein
MKKISFLTILAKKSCFFYATKFKIYGFGISSFGLTFYGLDLNITEYTPLIYNELQPIWTPHIFNMDSIHLDSNTINTCDKLNTHVLHPAFHRKAACLPYIYSVKFKLLIGIGITAIFAITAFLITLVNSIINNFIIYTKNLTTRGESSKSYVVLDDDSNKNKRYNTNTNNWNNWNLSGNSGDDDGEDNRRNRNNLPSIKELELSARAFLVQLLLDLRDELIRLRTTLQNPSINLSTFTINQARYWEFYILLLNSNFFIHMLNKRMASIAIDRSKGKWKAGENVYFHWSLHHAYRSIQTHLMILTTDTFLPNPPLITDPEGFRRHILSEINDIISWIDEICSFFYGSYPYSFYKK